MRTQKQNIEILKGRVTAVYFRGNKRVMTYGNIDRLTAVLELERKQNSEMAGPSPITMLIFEEGFLPATEVSWDLEDYNKYFKNKTDGVVE